MTMMVMTHTPQYNKLFTLRPIGREKLLDTAFWGSAVLTDKLDILSPTDQAWVNQL